MIMVVNICHHSYKSDTTNNHHYHHHPFYFRQSDVCSCKLKKLIHNHIKQTSLASTVDQTV